MRQYDVEVWDPFVRIGHWIIVIGFFVAYFTGEDFLSTHVWTGYVLAIIVLLRIVWGFVGPPHARFSDFIYGPKVVFSYLMSMLSFRAKRYIGHSPAGGAMVVVLLLSVAATIVTGLVVYAAEEKAGPLAPFYAASNTSSLPRTAAAERSTQAIAKADDGESENESLENLHELLANVTLALVVIHIIGVIFASIAHRENLIGAMLTGRKREPDA
jgi:cytochrome b